MSDTEHAELIAEARTAIADAERCIGYHIEPSSADLLRRLRQVTAALASVSAPVIVRTVEETRVLAAARAWFERIDQMPDNPSVAWLQSHSPIDFWGDNEDLELHDAAKDLFTPTESGEPQ